MAASKLNIVQQISGPLLVTGETRGITSIHILRREEEIKDPLAAWLKLPD